ncbi:hypothetical protein L484_025139 [Morus notabilis]|uniref:Uncharacterized protein n=1 Tax=Morus notabilis TaxID=981085 RepID=W9RAP1_9ROSA|nr:hypothetical protein L484_025139 [Morus notabilis]
MAIAHPHVCRCKSQPQTQLGHKASKAQLLKKAQKGKEFNLAQETSSPSQATICFPRVKVLLAESRSCAQDNPKKPKVPPRTAFHLLSFRSATHVHALRIFLPFQTLFAGVLPPFYQLLLIK